MNPQLAIEAIGLKKSYHDPKRGRVEAVPGVALAVRQGEVFGLLGQNGAGKTTTLRMLASILPPTEGVARID
ncbi:MAG: ATP-binding cassette domain-containing protein, partial [Planctomycetia bacterium]